MPDHTNNKLSASRVTCPFHPEVDKANLAKGESGVHFLKATFTIEKYVSKNGKTYGKNQRTGKYHCVYEPKASYLPSDIVNKRKELKKLQAIQN